MKAADIRKSFLAYFAERGHEVVPSSSLVPVGDPTLLFTNAGMVQFKSVFLGEETRPYRRAASSQKCVRAGGKHNDLENVGHTARHHTFFEMLGNFSFGDYFKDDAIAFAWEYLTEVLGLDRSRLYATVHESDDEAEAIWRQKIGLPAERVLRLGDADNFWAMGETGPCGPCSEILYDQGLAHAAPGGGGPGEDGERYLEIWNLVFMQLNRDASGERTALPRPSIDTGMGLERIAAVMQGAASNYDTDLLKPLVEAAGVLAGHRYGERPAADVSMRVLADHARAVAFLVADGVLPSNEGRGYVLRRILRRAANHGKQLGLAEPFLHRLTDRVVDLMGDAYGVLEERRAMLARVVRAEEERFLDALDRGLKVLDEAFAALAGAGERTLSGDVVFKLHDTYGFPEDLTRDIARGRGFTVDEAGFERALEEQRARGRASWKGARADGGASAELPPTRFHGYESLHWESPVARLFVGGEPVERAEVGTEVDVVVPETSFYAESGGQVGDRGWIEGPNGRLEVLDTRYEPVGVARHRARVVEGAVAVDDLVRLEVDPELRGRTRLNHSATHLAHQALRRVLGDHVRQQGSFVSPDRLRFDFGHFESPGPEALEEIERLVNEQIRANLEVSTREEGREDALGTGVLAFFGDKYGERVRVVRMGGFSAELCGGTHVQRTGDIGLFKIVHEGGVAAGVRRLEARTGEGALDYLKAERELLAGAAARLKVDPEGLADRIDKLLAQRRELERELERLKDQAAQARLGDLGERTREVAGVPVLISREEDADLMGAADRYKQAFPGAVLVLGAAGDKASLLVRVPDELADRFHAGRIMAELAPCVGGKGGGKPTMARGGGPEVAKLAHALDQALPILERLAAG